MTVGNLQLGSRISCKTGGCETSARKNKIKPDVVLKKLLEKQRAFADLFNAADFRENRC